MTKLYAINIALGTVSPAEIGIVVTTVAIILIGIALYVYNYRAQLKVFFYMDTQGSVYNSKGLEIYLKRNKRRLKSPTIVVVNLKNIDFLYQNYQKKTYLVTSICDTLLKGMTKIETVARIELGKYICIYSSKERQEIKDNCLKLQEKLNDFDFDNYGKFNFDIEFAIYENPDLSNPKNIISKSLAVLQFSTIREGNIKYYSNEVDLSVKRLETINETKNSALEKKQFVSYIQPKVDFRTGKVIGGEILARWIDENHNILYNPKDFIPLFEQNGFIKELDLLMFKNACILVQTMVNRGFPDIVISVNISKVLFTQTDFVDMITKVCFENGASPKNIEIEITETTIMKDFQHISNCIMELRSKGFKVAMDDFGEEYSSLGSLANNPFDTIKVDQIFFKNKLSTEKSRYIVKNLLDMLTKLKINIVCEGVEDQTTLDILSQINRDIVIQGYCYSMPITINQFEAFAATTFKMDYPEIIDYKQEAMNKESEVKSANSEIEMLKQQMIEMKEMFTKNLEEQRAVKEQQEVLELRRQLDEYRRRDSAYYDPRDREIEELRRELEYQKHRRSYYHEEDDKYDDMRREIDELKKSRENSQKNDLEEKLESERKEREILLKRLERLEAAKQRSLKREQEREEDLSASNIEESNESDLDGNIVENDSLIDESEVIDNNSVSEDIPSDEEETSDMTESFDTDLEDVNDDLSDEDDELSKKEE